MHLPRPVATAVLALTATLAFAQAPATTHGVVLSNMDPSVKPGDDFYLYANGAWQARTEIPADRSGITAFTTLGEVTDARIATIISEAASSKAAPRTDQRRIADLYRSYMDEATLNARGLAPTKAELAQIAAIGTSRELAHYLGTTLRTDVDALNNTNFHTSNIFGLWVAPGFNDPDHYMPYLLQGGLTLPSREYYVTNTPAAVALRRQYGQHVINMFKLAGFDKPELHAVRALDIEVSIARKHISLADNEVIAKANNTWKLADFEYHAPGLDWKEFFLAAGLGQQEKFIVWQPSAFAGEASIVAIGDLSAWRDYLTLHLLENNAGALAKPFADESFAFFGTVLGGATQPRPRDIRATAIVNAVLGDAVGQIYAKRYFPLADKAQVQGLVANLILAFRQRLQGLTWMAPATKAEAIAKLDALKIGIGYPDKWRSFDGLDIRPDDLFGNLQRNSLFQYRYQISRLGKPVDRNDWCMTPQTVNAVNLPLHNGLNFPAAILQPPFFDPKAPEAFNYGAIGSVIGHEISHTFDSQGAAFDATGRMRNWWTPADFAHFNTSTAALAKQYDAYKPFVDLFINGKQTLGENIADVAGLVDAYDAFHTYLAGKTSPIIDGLTGDQQFFLAYAQNRASKIREAALRRQVLTDPHSPGEYRTDAVRNLDAWYPTFNVKPGEKLYLSPTDRVRIW